MSLINIVDSSSSICKARGMAKRSELSAQRKKEGRGIFLATVLITSAIALGAWYHAPADFATNAFEIAYFIPAFIWFMLVGALVLIWEWKKLGMYLFFIALVLYVASPPALSLYYGQAFISIADYLKMAAMVGFYWVVLYFLLKRKMHLFK